MQSTPFLVACAGNYAPKIQMSNTLLDFFDPKLRKTQRLGSQDRRETAKIGQISLGPKLGNGLWSGCISYEMVL